MSWSRQYLVPGACLADTLLDLVPTLYPHILACFYTLLCSCSCQFYFRLCACLLACLWRLVSKLSWFLLNKNKKDFWLKTDHKNKQNRAFFRCLKPRHMHPQQEARTVVCWIVKVTSNGRMLVPLNTSPSQRILDIGKASGSPRVIIQGNIDVAYLPILPKYAT